MNTFAEKQLLTPKFITVTVQEDVHIFYRSAGEPTHPILLLLHGFPTSSNMFRNLIPLLASKFYIVAPDLPGFGFTQVPITYEFSFENITNTINVFLEELKITKYALYVFDYGAPVGYRLALKNPTSITGVIVQNGNAYEVGLDDRFWGPIKEYWQHQQNDPHFTQTFERYLQNQQNVISQYIDGVKDPKIIDPTNYTLDIMLLNRPNQIPIQIKLFYDYKTNIELYPQFQKFLRSADIPVLVVWGKNDTIFTTAGAQSYKKDAKRSKIVLLDTGHFALESHVTEIADEITTYFYNEVSKS